MHFFTLKQHNNARFMSLALIFYKDWKDLYQTSYYRVVPIYLTPVVF